MKNEETAQAFQNYREAANHVIESCEAFVAMDINKQPREAILVGIKAQLVGAKAAIVDTQERANKAKRDAESFRDMLPTSREFYADAKAEFGDNV